MRIKINEYAEYNLKIKESLDQQEFFQFLETLNMIAKMIKKDFLVDGFTEKEDNEESPNLAENKTKKLVKYNKNPKLKTLWDNREKTIKLVKLHYFGTEEKRKKAIEGFGITWKEISQRIWGIRKRYNILPREIGLKRFPTINDVSGDISKYKDRLNALRL